MKFGTQNMCFDKTKVIKLIVSFVLLVIGIFLYCNLKSKTFINELLDDLFLVQKLEHNTPALRFMYNWGCDIIWVSAFYLTLTVVCKKNVGLVIVLVVSIIYEFSQLFISNMGTFDIIDIVLEVISVFLLHFFFLFNRKED